MVGARTEYKGRSLRGGGRERRRNGTGIGPENEREYARARESEKEKGERVELRGPLEKPALMIHAVGEPAERGRVFTLI